MNFACFWVYNKPMDANNTTQKDFDRFEASKEIVGFYLAGMIDENTFNVSIVLLYKL